MVKDEYSYRNILNSFREPRIFSVNLFSNLLTEWWGGVYVGCKIDVATALKLGVAVGY